MTFQKAINPCFDPDPPCKNVDPDQDTKPNPDSGH